MDPDKVKAAIDAIEGKDGGAAVEILKGMLVDAAGDGEVQEETPAEEAPAEEALAEGADEEPVELASDEAPGEEEEEEEKELKALSANLRRLTGAASTADALDTIKALGERAAKIDAEQAALDTRIRRDLVTDLVKLGVETPATAWEGDAKDRKPVTRLSAEPLKDLRARVKIMRSARPALDETPAKSHSSGGLTSLSENDQARYAGLKKSNPVAAENFLTLRLSRRAN